MTYVVLVLTDGRDDVLEQTIDSAFTSLRGNIVRRVLHDDTGDHRHEQHLARRYGPLGFEVIGGPRAGFGGAIRRAWQYLCRTAEDDQATHVVHLEDDFTFNGPVHLDDMAAVLDFVPELAQVALRRQAWNDLEVAAGGVVELHPDWYADCAGGPHPSRMWHWLEHRVCFTTNPCVYRRSLCWRDWPTGEHSEGVFTHQLLGEGLRFAYLGERADGPQVHHIGEHRVGTGY